MRAESSWRTGYAFAKASGVLARSFIGSKTGSITAAIEPRSLYRLVYGTAAPELTEPALIMDAQKRLERRMRRRVAGVFWLLRDSGGVLEIAYLWLEAESAKSIMRALLRKEPQPADAYIGSSGIKIAAYPDAAAMFKGSRFPWMGKMGASPWGFADEIRIDRETWLFMWERARIMGDGRLKRLIALEARLLNAEWAVRLGKFYALDAAAIGPLLIDLPGVKVRAEALAAATFGADEKGKWNAWKLARFVNAETPNGQWSVDPIAFERNVEKYLYARFRSAFHSSGGSATSLYAFARLLRREAGVLRSAFEASRLGLEPLELETFLREAGA